MKTRLKLIMLMAGTSNLWSPTNLPDLVLWMDADSISGNDGDVIGSWTSREGCDYVFAQSVVENQPTLKTGVNGIAGRKSVSFDGSNDCLIYPSENITSSLFGHIVVVFSMAVSPGLNTFILLSSYGTSAEYWSYKASPPSLYNNDLGAEHAVVINQSIIVNTPYMMSFQSNGIIYTARINSVQKSFLADNSGRYNSGDWIGDIPDRANFTIGARSSPATGLFMNGLISEIIITASPLDSLNMARLENYLNTKYGGIFFETTGAFLPDADLIVPNYNPVNYSTIFDGGAAILEEIG